MRPVTMTHSEPLFVYNPQSFIQKMRFEAASERRIMDATAPEFALSAKGLRSP